MRQRSNKLVRVFEAQQYPSKKKSMFGKNKSLNNNEIWYWD